MSLTILYPTDGGGVDEQALEVDIVAVHGIGGHPFDTWTWSAKSSKPTSDLESKSKLDPTKPEGPNEILWLKDLLSIDLPTARVMTFGFERGVSFKKSTPITDLAKSLLECLMGKRSKDLEQQRPLIFLAHSMGGLVVKQALVYAHNDGRFHILEESTIGVMFFGTPHRGTEQIKYGGVLQRLANIMKKRDASLMKALQGDSDTLARLTQESRHQLSKYKLVSFYEGRPTGLSSSLIVDKHSAVLDTPWEIQIAVDADHQNMCKFSSQEDFAYRKCLSHIKSLLRDKAIVKQEISQGRNKHYMVPYSVTPIYSGREDIGKKLEETCLPSNSPNEFNKCYVLYGLGGSGKTQVCLKFAQDHRETFWGIFWIYASTEARIQQSLFDVARELCLEEDVYSVKRHLSQVAENWLLIIDNADDPSLGLSKYLPTGGKGSILITSRSPELLLHATVGSSEVGLLSPEDGVNLLSKASGDVVGSDPAVRESARSIVEVLDGLPLALVQAGGYIKQKGHSIDEFMEAYRVSRTQPQEHSLSENSTSHGTPLRKVFDLSIQSIEKLGTTVSLDALDILNFLSFVSCDINIEELLERAWANGTKQARPSGSWNYQLRVLCNPMNVEWQPFRLREALRLLASFYLVELEPDGNNVSTHRYIQEATRARLNKDESLRYSKVTASTLASAAGMSLETEGYGFREALLSHLSFFLSLHNDHSASEIGVVDWAEWLSSFSAAFGDSGRYERALELETRALELRNTLLGSEHPDTLRSMSRVGRYFSDIGRLHKAAAVVKKVFEARQKIFGLENRETLESMECLAINYNMQNRLQEATSLMEQALDLRQKVFGEADDGTITDMSHLAAYYRRLGRYLEALKLEEEVLLKRGRSLGEAHPDTLISMNNLAVTYGEIGQKQRATDLHEKVVSICMQILGDGHSDSATAMHNLAVSYGELGKHIEAVDLETRVLKLRRKHLGDTHPGTLRAMGNLATAYEATSQYQELLVLRRELLQRSEMLFGPNHPTTLSVMSDLATSNEMSGQYQDALQLREKLARLYETSIGHDNPATTKTRSNLATSYQITGLHKEAAALRKSPGQQNKRVLGDGQASQWKASSNEPLSLSSTSNTELHSSDSDSTCSEESTFSQALSGSSNTSSGAARTDFVERITVTFENDIELLFAYEDLMLFMSRRKFIRRHMRLLKSYFGNLHPTTAEQRQAVSLLGRSRQRKMVAESISNRTSLNKKLVRASEEMPNDLSRFNRLQLPDNSGEQSMSLSTDELGFVDQDQSCDESEDSDNDFSTEFYEFSVSEIDSMMHLLTTGLSYSQYKTSLQELAHRQCSPHVLRSVMRLGIVDALRGVLERHFEALAVKEFEWLKELRSLGYGYYDIAELLLDDMSNSPWIYFTQPEPQQVSIQSDFHTSNCVHQGGRRTSSAPKLIVADFENTEDLKKIIAEHCGLAGVVPKSRDLRAWTGLVTFLDKDRSTASITYATTDFRHELVSRVCEALQRFCGIATYLQKKGLCCNSFTVLRYATINGHTVIELRPLSFGLAFDLFVVLQLLVNNWESPGLISRCLPRLNEIANQVIYTVCDTTISGNKEDIKFESCLDKVSLAVQVLTLGLYLYSQAHTGTVHPFFLTNPLSHLYLLGTQSLEHDSAGATIWVTPSRLTCMAGVTGDFVNVFGSLQFSEASFAERAYDLLASPADLAETWDAWRLIMDATKPHTESICAIQVGEGFVSSAGEIGEGRYLANAIPKLHWSKEAKSLDFKTPFNLHTKALIGTTVVNHSCPVDEHRSWLCANVAMDTLGAEESYWERSEAQVGLQGGQYVIAQFNLTWVKRPGTTLKHIHLQPDISLPFLQSDWGLQISYCTGVARRVSLCDLLADVTPILIEELLQKPPGWKSLKENHNIVAALRGANFQEWFDSLVPDLQSDVLRIVRYVLLVLQDTGIDRSGEHLVAVWPRKGSPLGCFKIPCKDATYWARMLQDSSDCATFAYVSPLCLETHQWKCQKLETAPWLNRSVVLNTAVSPHKFGVTTAGQWRLRHEQSYLIGQPGRYLVGKVSLSMSPFTMHVPPHLDISKSTIPSSMQARIQEHLRERQSTNAPAHGVFVLTNHPHSLFLGFK
ncbi:MAG: hypothetical protein M1837_001290 [Sclerophora amabilis]|nr:MAG: hypothetical protein M1837_001290 [Sclerophora amabilis]